MPVDRHPLALLQPVSLSELLNHGLEMWAHSPQDGLSLRPEVFTQDGFDFRACWPQVRLMPAVLEPARGFAQPGYHFRHLFHGF